LLHDSFLFEVTMQTPAAMNRRDLLRLGAFGGSGLALGGMRAGAG